MKRHVIAIPLIILAMFLVYAVFGFVAWDWNPGHWDEDMRMWCALLVAGGALIAVGVIQDIT